MKNIDYRNRGKAFENELVYTNNIYKIKGWAFIEKTEPPFKSLPSYQLPPKLRNGKNHYLLGYYESKGFVDFFGVCQGRALAFEAKSTKNKTRFPLSNIKSKQMDDLKYWHDLGGIAFILIYFEKHGEVYLMMYDELQRWWEGQLNGERKSIPYEWFNFHCFKVEATRGVVWDYLKGLGIQ